MMGTSRDDLRGWFIEGVELKATHMIVVCDTFDYSDYPVYVAPTENVREVEAAHQLSAGNMQRVVEIYRLDMDMDKQINSLTRVNNY